MTFLLKTVIFMAVKNLGILHRRGIVMIIKDNSKLSLKYEPRCEKTDLRGFRPGPTQIGLRSHRRWLEAWNFIFRK